jgi:hypothetical protein
MESVDVIHSFWVPNFGQKMDAVPGIETTILVTPTRTGDFAVVCTELCGLGHATMRAKARVVTQSEFAKVDRGAEGVTATHPEQAEQYPAHFEPPRGSTWRMFFGPGLVRGAWMAVLGFGLGTALVCLLRAWWGWDPVWNTQIVLLVGGMVVAPIFFLAASGPSTTGSTTSPVARPFPRTTPATARAPGRTTSGSIPTTRSSGSSTWSRLRLLRDRRPDGDVLPRRARAAGPPVRRLADVQRPRLVHATLMIFLFIIPAFAGLANFAVPLMLGAPDMAFPRLNALSYWLLPIAGIMFVASFLAPGGAFASGWTGTHRCPRGSRSVRRSSTWASSGRGRRAS